MFLVTRSPLCKYQEIPCRSSLLGRSIVVQMCPVSHFKGPVMVYGLSKPLSLAKEWDALDRDCSSSPITFPSSICFEG
jgi:hypothetical protein